MSSGASVVSSDRNFSDCLLITIHGVQSNNKNLEKVVENCKNNLPGLKVHYIWYRCLHPVLVLGPTARELSFSAVRTEIKTIKELTQQNKALKDQKRFFVFAHSFGTLALLKYLQDADKFDDLVIETAVLAGSILPQGTDWRPFINKQVLKRHINNMTRPFDWVVRAASLLLAEQTVSGTRGFVKIGLESLTALNIFKFGGHSAYAKADGKDLSLIIQEKLDTNWICEEEKFISKLKIIERARLEIGRKLGII